MASTTSRPTRSMSSKGAMPGRVKIRHISSTSSGPATPSSTTIRHSLLMAAQIRLKITPFFSPPPHPRAPGLDGRPDPVEDDPVALAPDAERREPVLRQLGHQHVDDLGVG